MRVVRTVFLISTCFWLWLCPIAPALANRSLQAGAAALTAGDYSNALDQFTRAIKTAPEIAYSDRCLTYLQMQRFQAAIDDCTQALSFNPHQAEAGLNLGLAYHSLGQYDRAITSYQQLLQFHPDDYRAHYNLGVTAMTLDQPAQAIARYNKALEKVSKTASTSQAQANIYRDRGTAHLLLTHYAAAITDLNAAIEQAPDDLWAHFNRGCAYHRSHNFLPALKDFRWVTHQDQQNAQAYYNQGTIHMQMSHLGLAGAFEQKPTVMKSAALKSQYS